MINTQYLEEKIKNSGYKKQFLAAEVGCSAQYLTMKINNKAEFKVDEVQTLSKVLKLSTAERNTIFFA